MFFAGIYVKENHREGAAVVVEKHLKRARKEYIVHDCQLWTRDTPLDNPVATVKAMYDNPRFVQKKKVFSQSKRPPKNTYSPPMLIVSVENGDKGLIGSLRENQIPVEALFFHSQDGWVKEEQNIIRYGGNYNVNPDVLTTLMPLLASPGLIGENAFDHAQKLKDEIERCRKGAGAADLFTGTFDLLPALFLSLWHSETIRQVKRY